LREGEMALKNKRKWIFLSILIVALSIGITFALVTLNTEIGINPKASVNAAPNSPGNGGVGDGTLYVYIDAGRTIEAPIDLPSKIYLVLPGKLYYFRIAGIKEYREGQTIHIWANYSESDYPIGDYTVGSGGIIDFEWTIPTLPYQTKIKYKYGLNLTGPNPSWHFAKRTTQGVGITLVIPQVPLGVLGATSAVIAAYGIKALTRKKRLFSK
jgi:hypothetical protein